MARGIGGGLVRGGHAVTVLGRATALGAVANDQDGAVGLMRNALGDTAQRGKSRGSAASDDDEVSGAACVDESLDRCARIDFVRQFHTVDHGIAAADSGHSLQCGSGRRGESLGDRFSLSRVC